MKLKRFYELVVKFGNDRDPRNRRVNAYEDTAVLYGSPDTQIRKILVGIDAEASELLLGDRIREKEGLDLVLAHHPEGKAFASLYKVMQLQVDVLMKAGMQESVAQKLLNERMLEVERRLLPQNHTRAVDAARLLNLPFICVHTPADNHVYHYIQQLMNSRKPDKLSDVLSMLNQIPEYRQAEGHFSGPRIVLGNPSRKAGKIIVEMTGGTEGSKDVFDKLYKKGIRTIICMHISDEHFKKAKEAGLNVIIAGHISSDNLGLNLLLDRIEKEEPLTILSCSGFNRIKRK